MAPPEYVPFGEDDPEKHWALVDGVPAWLREPLFSWIASQLAYDSQGRWASSATCVTVQLNTRLDLGVTAGDLLQDMGGVLYALRRLGPLEILKVADYLVSTTGSQVNDRSRSLERILSAGSSKWRVGDRAGRLGLVERVPAGVQDAVEGVIAESSNAGQLLARAWAKVHSLVPEDSDSYSSAVRAVEVAAIGVVVPRKKDATLGDVIGIMDSQRDWALPLREHEKAPHVEVMLGMLRTLWHGHRDRHGTTDYSDVTHEEARAAVVLAAVLVDWFVSGAVSRVSAGPPGA